MKLLLASTSSIHGHSYLSYFKNAWINHFTGLRGPVIFVPYARPGGISWDNYTSLAAEAFNSQGIELRGIHTYNKISDAVEEAGGFFIGGGNTFVLLKTLIENGSFNEIDKAVREGKPYMGSSAGTNIAGTSIGTTNDMPIEYPLLSMHLIGFHSILIPITKIRSKIQPIWEKLERLEFKNFMHLTKPR